MSNAQFRALFDGLVQAIDEYEHLIPILLESVLPGLANRQSMLDVGAGPGLLAAPLAAHFEEVTLVEPDQVYIMQAAEKVLSQGRLLTAFNGILEEASLGGRRYDLILGAHVLYFVPAPGWGAFIDKMIDHLAPGGQLALILVAREGAANDIIRRALQIPEVGEHPFSAAAQTLLRQRGHPFDVLTFTATVRAPTPAALLELMALFPIMSYDEKSSEATRLAMIGDHFQAEGGFRLPYTVDLIRVRSPV